MPGASVAAALGVPPPSSSTPTSRKGSLVPERKYQCQFCNRAFSRSEHRSRHERSHTKERPFKCMKCRSTFVRRDLLLRHDRTVHAKDGGIPLHSDGKRRAGPKTRAINGPAKSPLALDTAALEQMEDFDVETAAMLVADLHHKATAAMRDGGGPYHEPAIFPSSGQWDDSFMPSHHHNHHNQHRHPAAETEPNSLTSSTSGFSTSTATLAPAIHSLIDSAVSSHAGTPCPQSPMSVVASTITPNTATTTTTIKPPQINGEDERNIILDNIRGDDDAQAIPEEFRLPQLASLNRYLSTYFSLFHHHLPFLHPVSFKPTEVAPSLLLAALSIGALYAFDQDQAYMLHIGSKVLVNQFLHNKENFSSRKCPLWTMQSSLLNMVFASWSGDPKGLEWACSIKSLLANMVAGNRYELKLRQEARGTAAPTRAEWVEDEGCRRTYYAVYIFFGLLTMTFNHTPAISFNEFEDLQLPSSEALWNSPLLGSDDDDDDQQQHFLDASPTQTFMEAHGTLFQGEVLKYSAFATRVMINALFLEVWYHKRSPEALQDVVTEYKLRLALETWQKSLALCEVETVAPITTKTTTTTTTTTSSTPLPHKGHPLIFNAQAMYRNARVRLEVDLKSVQEALRYHDPYEVAAAMSNARDRVKRSGEMLKVIDECFTSLETAVLRGVRWVARTSPTNWSVEHPLCGMDLMIVLSMWLYRLEHDEEPATDEELVMYNKVRQLLTQHVDPGYDSQLSSIVARLWGSMLDVVVVWGITRLMGESFKLHSQALVGYVDDVGASSAVSTPSMISQGADEDSVY